MSLAIEALARLPILQQRLDEAHRASHPFTYTVWRRRSDGHISYCSHRLPLSPVHPEFEILGDFDNKLETLEFIVAMLLWVSL